MKQNQTCHHRSPELRPDKRTLEELADLAGIGCTASEMAAHFKVSEDALEDFVAATPAARNALIVGDRLGMERLRQKIENRKTSRPQRIKSETSAENRARRP